MSILEKISNWDRRPLRREQMIYAAMDAYVVLALYTSIQDTAQKRGKYDKLDQVDNFIICVLLSIF